MPERLYLARRAGSRRGSHTLERSAGPGAGRDLRGGRPALRRADPLSLDHRDRPDQLLEPPHRHREAASGLVPRLSGTGWRDHRAVRLLFTRGVRGRDVLRTSLVEGS